MENAFAAVSVAYFAWSVVALWRKDRQIEHCIELLASRSFGEYANGKAKLTNPKPVEDIDPGF